MKTIEMIEKKINYNLYLLGLQDIDIESLDTLYDSAAATEMINECENILVENKNLRSLQASLKQFLTKYPYGNLYFSELKNLEKPENIEGLLQEFISNEEYEKCALLLHSKKH